MPVTIVRILSLVIAALALQGSPEEHYRRGTAALSARDYPTAVSELRFCVRLNPRKAEFQYAYALALSQTGTLNGARQAIDECLRLSPGFPGAHFLAGQILTASGNLGSALPHFQEAERSDPSNVEILNSLGLTLAGLSKFQEAARRFSSVTERTPQFPGAHYNLGLCFVNLGDFPAAVTSFQKLLKLAPSHEKGRVQLAHALLAEAQQQTGRSSKMREAAEAYREVIRLRPQDPDLHFNLAFALARSGDNQEALEEYRQVVRLQPDYPLVHFNLGLTCYFLSDWTGAEEHLGKAMEKREEAFLTAYYLGSTLLKTRKLDEAEACLKRATSLKSDYAGVHFQLATLYRLRGEADRAREESRLFQELSAREETNRNLEALQSSAKAALEKGDIAAGMNALRHSYERRPDAISARNLALAYLQSGDASEARRLLGEALRMSPRDAASYNYLGLLESREGKPALAKQHFEKAVELDASFVEALYNAGVAAANLGEIEVALQRFKAAMTLRDSAQVREALAVALERAGRLEEARHQFHEAEKLKRDIRMKP